MKGWMKYHPAWGDLPYYDDLIDQTTPLTTQQMEAVVEAIRLLSKAYNMPWADVLETQARLLTESEYADIVGELQQ